MTGAGEGVTRVRQIVADLRRLGVPDTDLEPIERWADAQGDTGPTERCPRCNGGGTHPDHDRGCPGGGPICEAQCPVEVLCELCRGDGLVPVGTTEDDDDEPF